MTELQSEVQVPDRKLHKAVEPFGVYLSPQPETPGTFEDAYEVSRTGIILYSKVPFSKPQVLSMVNGSMCINPLGEFICSVSFDHYAIADLLAGGYKLPKQDLRKPKDRQPTQEPLAYFDPRTNTYTAIEYLDPDGTHSCFEQRCEGRKQAHFVGDEQCSYQLDGEGGLEKK